MQTGLKSIDSLVPIGRAFPKLVSETAEIGGVEVKINGIAKGSGMIAPDMATMLSFIFTDAKIAAPVLQSMLVQENQGSFNSITVDGDTHNQLLQHCSKSEHCNRSMGRIKLA